MSHTIFYNPEINILEITFKDTIAFNDLKAAYEEVLPIAIQKNCFLFLNDFQEATLSMSTFDIVSWAETILEMAKKYELNASLFRRAIILPISFGDSSFAETVALNRGHWIRLFKSPDEARAWLAEK